MSDASSTWGGPVIIYDRCPSAQDLYLAARMADCRNFADLRGCPVAAEHIDSGPNSLTDGPDARDRAELAEAIRACIRTGAYLLVWHPDRISHHAVGRAPVIETLSGRILHSRGGLVVTQTITGRALTKGVKA